VRALAWHWVVAGDGPERDALARAVDAADLADRVTFAHECPASVLYPRAELVLSPSRWEGMPLVPMEAVEAGVPVLASAIAPHGELFRDAPSSLLPADEARWAESLHALLAEPAARHTLAAEQRRALPRDPRAALGDAYLTLYRTVSLL
jgi:glycosyltransferase involved in cell wall biosynthesis